MTAIRGLRREQFREGDPRRPITLQLDCRTLATLQYVSAAIRREAGAAIGMSAIVRALVQWLAETEIDFGAVRKVTDLETQVLPLLSGRGPKAADGGD